MAKQAANPEDPNPPTSAEKEKLCGHVDQHSFGPDGKFDHPKCTLESGHTGDHQGLHKMQQIKNRTYDEKGRVIETEYEIVEVVAFWGDAAGTPASKIKKGKMPSRNKRGDLESAIMALATSQETE
jgi:hypothetical protein